MKTTYLKMILLESAFLVIVTLYTSCSTSTSSAKISDSTDTNPPRNLKTETLQVAPSGYDSTDGNPPIKMKATAKDSTDGNPPKKMKTTVVIKAKDSTDGKGSSHPWRNRP